MDSSKPLERFGEMAIAVIGMAGRFPKADTIDLFWRNLKNGVESVSFFSDEELTASGIPPAVFQRPNYVRAKACLSDIARFDAELFGFNPSESKITDVQHRIFLECAYAALEDAGCDPRRYEGLIGVFAGSDISTYFLNNILPRYKDSGSATVFQALLSNDKDFLATMVSYRLDLKGPSINVQTACSTSLTAIHLACQALLNGECDIGLAGGVSVSIPSQTGYLYEEGMIFSADGHCRAFDEKAAGTIAGNGCGIVVLKRLEDAVEDGDAIYAVIRGSAMNNDGAAKVGFTAPGVSGQMRVIQEALSVSGVDPETMTYIETHGTGTALGDPIEIDALTQAFETDKKQFCAIGSVKTNIGHLNSAAGVTGVIKTALSLHHGQIPPSLNYQRPNPQIDFENGPFYVNTDLKEWAAGNGPRRAGVSSFGIGGTNVHVVLEEFPRDGRMSAGKTDSEQRALIVLSAQNRQALDEMTVNLAYHMRRHPDLNIDDIAYTLQTGRKAHPQRRFVTCRTLAEAAEALDSETPISITDGVMESENPPVVFMFSGQGAQYAGMGWGIYQTQPVFRETVDRCCRLLAPFIGVDLRRVIYPDKQWGTVEFGNETGLSYDITRTRYAQPCLFIIEYALAQLFISWGIRPAAMIGHSIGEYTAAAVSGVFSIEDALKIVALRGQLMDELPEGAMLAATIPEDALKPFLNDDVELAVVNSPSLCVASGSKSAIGALRHRLSERNIECRLLHTSHAFHSKMTEPMLSSFIRQIKDFPTASPAIPIISNRTGTWMTSSQAGDPSYWADHLRNTVRFSDGLYTLMEHDHYIYLEIGPGRTLGTFVRDLQQTLKNPTRRPAVLSSIRHPKETRSDVSVLMTTVGKLWISGIDIDWDSLYPEKPRKVHLPTYPFQGENHYIEPPRTDAGIKTECPVVPAVEPKSSEDSKNDVASDVLGDSVQKIVTEIFEEILCIEGIGFYDDFFDLGGNSLAAARIVSRIKDRYPADFSIKHFFEQPTIHGISEWIRNRRTEPVPPDVPASPLTDSSDVENPIEKTPDAPHYPVSNAQRRLWLLSQMVGGGAAYNMPWALVLEGKLDQPALEKAFSELVRRHESLRTTFGVVEGEVRQRIDAAERFHLEFDDLSSESHPMDRARNRIDQESVTPIDLEKGPLFRVILFKISDDKHILLLVMHHIISDGWSNNLMVNEFRRLYEAFSDGAPNPLKPLRIQYRDFAVWQNRLLQSPEIDIHRNYWHRRLSGEISPLALPTDFQRPAIQSFKGDTVSFALSSGRAEKLKAFCKIRKVSLYMVFMTAVKVLLHRYTEQSEIIVGSPTAGRVHPELEHQVGFYLNTLVLKDEIDPETSLSSFLNQVKTTATEAFDHQIYPFDKLVDEMALKRDVSRNPFFDVLVVMQNIAPINLDVRDLKISIMDHDVPMGKFDLTFECFELEAEAPMHITYNTDLFKRDRIERMAEHLMVVIDGLLNTPDVSINRLEIMTPEETRKVLEQFNDTRREYPSDQTVIDIIEEQVRKTGDHPAVIFQDASITYREFNRSANKIAHRLIREGVTSSSRVGVLLERSPEMAASLFGVLKTGAAYVPLSAEDPVERISYIVADAGVSIIVTQRRFAGRFDAGAPEILYIDTDEIPGNRLSEENVNRDIDLSDPAYVVYTSGSTGRPKGVLNTHLGIYNQLKWRQEYFGLTPEDRVLHKTPLSFDNSIWELFWPLSAGATTVIASPEAHKDAVEIKRTIIDNKVTTVHFVPSMLRVFLDIDGVEACRSLKRVFSGGEPLPIATLNSFKKRFHIPFYNLYGQSEAAMNTTCMPCENFSPDGGSTTPIGIPIANTRIRILDSVSNPTPIGVPGEIHIAGDGLAIGYINRPDLDEKQFIPDPFDPKKDSRMFKTGDIGRWRRDGTIEFLGRREGYVKVRGVRIEPGEIERCLLTHPDVAQCAVSTVIVDDQAELAAYIEPYGHSSALFDVMALKTHLKKSLPDAMIPAYFVPIDTIPRTKSGKIDRKNLPHPGRNRTAETEYVPPANEVERALEKIWKEILDVSRVSVHDNFFDLGGHSLRAARMVSRIQKELGVEIALGEIFLHPTIRELSDKIRSGFESKTAFSPLACIQSNGNKTPLFFMHIARGDVFCYAQLSRYIGNEHPFYGLRAFGLDPGTQALTSIPEMAAAYVNAIREVYPAGPYVIGGHSRGGVIAYEMAQQLLEDGQDIPLLVFIDAFAPEYLERPTDLWEYFMQFKHIVDLSELAAFYGKIRRLDSMVDLDEAREDFDALSYDEKLSVIWNGAVESGLLDDEMMDVDEAIQNRILNVAVTSGLSVAQYKNIKPYSGKIAFFRATDNIFVKKFGMKTKNDPAMGWGKYASNIDIYDIEGADHASIVQSPYVEVLAQKLNECLKSL